MAEFIVQAAAPMTRLKHPRVQIVGEAGTRITLPLASELENSGLAPRYVEGERVGDVDTITKTSRPIHTISATWKMVGRDTDGNINPLVSVEPELQLLRSIARTGERFELVGYGNSAGGQWVFADLGWTDTRRRVGDNAISQADVSVVLKRVGESKMFTGALTGGAVGGAGNGALAAAAVAAGGSLMQLASAAYGNAQRWFDIADANKVLAPHRLTQSTVLSIPRP